MRALNDLHTIAAVAERAADTLEGLDNRAARMEVLGERFLDLGERLEAQAGEILEVGNSMDELGRSLHSQAKLMDAHAARVQTLGEEIVAALPTVERGISLVSPLEGAVERIGRVVDRLPGDPRRGIDPALPQGDPDPLARPDEGEDQLAGPR